jgi:hypothetical protein
MQESLKELIMLSTENGMISEERRELIYNKAVEHGVSREECDVYIESSIRTNLQNKKIATNSRNIQGVWYIVAAILDFIAAAYFVAGEFVGGFLACILSGLFLLFWGLHTLNALNKESMLIFVKSPITHSVLLIGSYFTGIMMTYNIIAVIVFSIVIPYLLLRQLKFQKAWFFSEVITVLLLSTYVLSFSFLNEHLYPIKVIIDNTLLPALFLLALVLSLEIITVDYSSKLSGSMSKIFGRFNRVQAIMLAGIILIYNMLDYLF